MRHALAALAAAAAAATVASALDNGLARTPPMGFNSWTAFGTSVTAADLMSIADFFESSGLAKVGYSVVTTDDGWTVDRDPVTGRIVPDPKKFPNMTALADYMHSKGLKLGVYSAASSVVCSGRPGSLYHEAIDAQTFAEWGVDYVKYDNCGEYGLGNARFTVWADAVNATGRPMVISTEPFDLVPNPASSTFANLWRTTNDINSGWSTILDRIDTNDKFAPMAGPGRWNDPDMLQVGNGGRTDAECRTHLGLWALSKAPLILGTDVARLSQSQLAIVGNADVIAVNQDPLAVQARKLAVNGTATPRFVGLAPCGTTGNAPGYNGVSASTIVWTPLPSRVNATAGTVMLYHNASNRCLTVGPYGTSGAIFNPSTPLLMPCDETDPAQAWLFPTTPLRVGGLLNFAATIGYSGPNGTLAGSVSALAVANSTLYGTQHGTDDVSLLDAAYGLTNLNLAAYQPEAVCTSRSCDDYVPGQSWYWSPRTGQLQLSHFSANNYRCYEPNCYRLTSHVPTWESLCLSSVLSISNLGTDPNGSITPGHDVWGGPLSGGDFVFALVNRDAAAASVEGRWSMLEVPGVGDATTFCARELYTNKSLGALTGGVQLTVQSHDIAMLRLTPPGPGGACA